MNVFEFLGFSEFSFEFVNIQLFCRYTAFKFVSLSFSYILQKWITFAPFLVFANTFTFKKTSVRQPERCNFFLRKRLQSVVFSKIKLFNTLIMCYLTFIFWLNNVYLKRISCHSLALILLIYTYTQVICLLNN